jgi:hypothetical protein
VYNATNTTSKTVQAGGTEQGMANNISQQLLPMAWGETPARSEDTANAADNVGRAAASGHGLASRPRGGCGGLRDYGGPGARLVLRGGGWRANGNADGAELRRASGNGDSSMSGSVDSGCDARRGRKGASGRCGDGRGRGWDWHYKELLYYRSLHGDTLVPQSQGSLGMWAAVQRHQAAAGSICAVRMRKLNSAGFNFDPLGDAWDRNFWQLLLYRQLHGDCNPLQAAPDGQGALGRWVGQQRHLYQSGSLRADRILRLISAGFIFNKADLDWERHFSAFQRQQEHQRHLEMQRQKESASAPAWTAQHAARSWQLHSFAASSDFLHPNGVDSATCRVNSIAGAQDRGSQVLAQGEHPRGALSSTSLQNPSVDSITPLRLMSWISYQRDLRRRGRLRAERMLRLEAAGMVWNVHDAQWCSKLERVRRCLQACLPNIHPHTPARTHTPPAQTCGAPAPVEAYMEGIQTSAEAAGWCGEGPGHRMPGVPRGRPGRQSCARARGGVWQEIQSHGLGDVDLLQWLQNQQGQLRRNRIRADRLQELEELSLLPAGADRRLPHRVGEREQGKVHRDCVTDCSPSGTPVSSLRAIGKNARDSGGSSVGGGGGGGGGLNLLPAPITWR